MNHTKLFFALLFSTVCTIRASAQTDERLPGVVVLQNSRVKQKEAVSLPDVQITAIPGPVARSDAFGKFTLVFADKPFGGMAKIMAQKQGYEVVNGIELENATVLGRTMPLKIVMCPEGALIQNQLRYYKIGEQIVLKKYQWRRQQLKIENARKQSIIDSLQQETGKLLADNEAVSLALTQQRDQILGMIEDFATQFAMVNLDDVDSLYLAAHNAWIDGRIDDALSILNEKVLNKNLDNIQKNLQNIRQAGSKDQLLLEQTQNNLRQSIQNALFAARTAALDFKYTLAEQYFELAIHGSENELKPYGEYIRFLTQIGKTDKAIAWCRRALPHAPDIVDQARYQAMIGGLYAVKESRDSAKMYLTSAEQIITPVLEKNLTVYGPVFARIQLTKQNLYLQFREYPEAERVADAAIAIAEALKKQPNYVPDMLIADAYKAKGNLLAEQLRFEQAIESLEKSLAYYTQLDQKNPENQVATADAAIALANAWRMGGRNDRAMNYVNQGIQTIGPVIGLKESNKADYAFMLLNAASPALQGLSNIPAALDSCKKAIVLYTQLEQHTPLFYRRYLGWCYQQTGIMLNTGRYSLEAWRNLDTARVIFEALLRKDSVMVALDLARTLENLASAQLNISERGFNLKADIPAKRALKLFKQHAQKDLKSVILEYAHTHLTLASYYADLVRDTQKAEYHFLAAIALYDSIAVQDRKPFTQYIGSAYTNIFTFYMKQKRYKEAENILNMQLALYDDMSDDPAMLMDRVYALRQQATLYQSSAKDSMLIKNLDKALHILEKMPGQGDRIRFEQGFTYQMYGNYFKAKNNRSQALMYYDSADVAYNQVKKPNVFQLRLQSSMLFTMDSLCRQLGNTEKQIHCLEEIVSIFEQHDADKSQTGSFFINAAIALISVYEAQADTSHSYAEKAEIQAKIVLLLEKIGLYIPSMKQIAQEQESGARVSLSWYLLLSGDFNGAKAEAQKALNLDSKSISAKLNLAHAFSLLKQNREAEDLYYEISHGPSEEENKQIKELIIKDLEDIKKAGIKMRHVKRILSKINQK